MVFLKLRRVDDAGNVAGSAEHEFHRPAKQRSAREDRFRRRDMVVAGGEIVDRDLDIAEIDPFAGNAHQSTREIVLEITIAQIKRVAGGGHPGRIGVPVEQVEGQGLGAAQVIIDHIGPDEIGGAQHVEDGRHDRAVEITDRLHVLVQRRQLAFVNEDLEVAGMDEIGLGGQQRGATDAFIAFLRMQRQRRG
ncbi:hypothetical protein D3C80_235980 [compost metagenome]